MSSFFSPLLQIFIDWTDNEIALGKKFLDWNEVNIQWQNLELHWEDIFILLSKRGGSSARGLDPYKDEELKRYVENNPWNKARELLGEEKAEKLIKVICNINGVDYNSIIENNDNVRVVINDFIRNVDEKEVNIKINI